MTRKPDKVEIAREKEGKCNLCLENKELTWEHIVPQAALFYTDLILKSVHQHVHGDQINYDTRISQNGLKLRTVCSSCNSKLGSKFDPALIDFLRSVKSFAESRLTISDVVSVKCKPNAIIRSILGHLIAAKYHLEFSQFDETVRKIIFDSSQPIPSSLNLYYWPYPFKNIAAYRDILMLSRRGAWDSKPAVFQVLICYPVSFLVTNLSMYENLPTLKMYNSSDPDKVEKISLNLSKNKPPEWPVTVGLDNFVGFGQAGASSITGVQKEDIEKRKS